MTGVHIYVRNFVASRGVVDVMKGDQVLWSTKPTIEGYESAYARARLLLHDSNADIVVVHENGSITIEPSHKTKRARK